MAGISLAKKAKRAKRMNPIVKVLLIIGLVYTAGNMIVTCIKLQVQIHQKKEELAAVEAKITVQSVKNEELNNILNAQVDREYVENVARSLGYGTVGERVYDNVSGD